MSRATRLCPHGEHGIAADIEVVAYLGQAPALTQLSATWARIPARTLAWPEWMMVYRRERSVSASGSGSRELGSVSSDGGCRGNRRPAHEQRRSRAYDPCQVPSGLSASTCRNLVASWPERNCAYVSSMVFARSGVGERRLALYVVLASFVGIRNQVKCTASETRVRASITRATRSQQVDDSRSENCALRPLTGCAVGCLPQLRQPRWVTASTADGPPLYDWR